MQIARDSAFSTIVLDQTLTGSTTSLAVPAGTLEYGTTYFWRVKVYDGIYWSAYSAARSFKTDIAYKASDELDDVGNITTRTIVTAKNGSQSASYIPDAMNRLTSLTSGGRTESFSYDANGNMTFRYRASTWQFIYDVQDRLTSVVMDGVELAHYTYDGEGTLVKAYVRQNACDQGKTTIYVYDGLQPVYEVDYAGNTTSGTPLATRTYLYGQGQAVARVDNTGTINYYLRSQTACR